MSSWTKVYENDAQGAATFGTIQALMDAIRQGNEVRMRIRYPNVADQEFFLPAESLWIRHGNVYAQNTSLVSASFADTDLLFQEEAYLGFIIASTTGLLDQSRWLVGEHTSRGHTRIRASVTWYAG